MMGSGANDQANVENGMSFYFLAAAAASAAFNLVCTGTITTDSLSKRGATEPYKYTYRIDLDKKKFCEESCVAIRDIYEVQPGFLKLSAPENVDTIDEKRFSDSTIDRQSGHQSTLMSSGRRANILIMKWDGECEKIPFTGFPVIKGKF